MERVTPTRAATAAAGLAVLAGAVAPALAMYLTVVATAGLLGAAFAAYLAAVDRPDAAALMESAACATAGMLVLVDAALRFPELLSGGGPPVAERLAQVAFGLVVAAVLAPAAVSAWRTAVGRAGAPAVDGFAGRSARLWRRLVDAA
jgi:hypothetical protein